MQQMVSLLFANKYIFESKVKCFYENFLFSILYWPMHVLDMEMCICGYCKCAFIISYIQRSDRANNWTINLSNRQRGSTYLVSVFYLLFFLRKSFKTKWKGNDSAQKMINDWWAKNMNNIEHGRKRWIK